MEKKEFQNNEFSRILQEFNKLPPTPTLLPSQEEASGHCKTDDFDAELELSTNRDTTTLINSCPLNSNRIPNLSQGGYKSRRADDTAMHQSRCAEVLSLFPQTVRDNFTDKLLINVAATINEKELVEGALRRYIIDEMELDFKVGTFEEVINILRDLGVRDTRLNDLRSANGEICQKYQVGLNTQCQETIANICEDIIIGSVDCTREPVTIDTTSIQPATTRFYKTEHLQPIRQPTKPLQRRKVFQGRPTPFKEEIEVWCLDAIDYDEKTGVELPTQSDILKEITTVEVKDRNGQVDDMLAEGKKTDAMIQLFHGTSLKGYRKLLQQGEFARTFSSATGNLFPRPALYFSNCGKYALLGAEFETSRHFSTPYHKLSGVVVRIDTNLRNVPGKILIVESKNTDSYIRRCLEADLDLDFPSDTVAVIGGFDSSHKSELAGPTSSYGGNPRRGLQWSSRAGRYLDIETLMQVVLVEEMGQMYINRCEMKVFIIGINWEDKWKPAKLYRDQARDTGRGSCGSGEKGAGMTDSNLGLDEGKSSSESKLGSGEKEGMTDSNLELE